MAKGLSFSLSATNRGGAAMKSFSGGLMGIKKAQDAVNRSNRGFMRGMSANRRIVQQVGMQVSDLGVQIAGGQSAILSLTQNVPQVIQMFGAWGGILAGVITLLGTFTLVMVKSGVAFSDIANKFGSVTGEMEAFGRAMVSIREITFNAINAVINNLDQLAVTLALVAGWFAGKGLVAVVRATGAFRLLSLALLVTNRRGLMAGATLIWKHGVIKSLTAAVGLLRGALMRLGLPALIIAAGYLVERFMTLRQATGSWGEALGLVGALSKEVFMNLPEILTGVGLRIAALFTGMLATIAQWGSDAAGVAGDVGNIFVNSFIWVAASIKEIFETIAISIGNAIADIVNGMVNRFMIGINMMIHRMKQLKIPVDYIEFDMAPVVPVNASKDGSTLGQRIDGLGNSIFAEDRMGGLSNGLNGAADAARNAASGLREMSDAAFGEAYENMPALQRIRELLKTADANQDRIDIRDWFGNSKDDDEALDALLKRLKRAQTEAQQAVGTLSATFSDPVIDMSVDQFMKSLGRLENLPSYIYDDAAEGIMQLRDTIKGQSVPIQAEIDKLREIMEGDLQEVDPEKFFGITTETITRLQELTIPIRQEMEEIRRLDPRLKELNFDVFEDSMNDALRSARTKTDDLREILSQVFDVDVFKLPEIDTNPTKEVLGEIEQVVKELGETLESGLRSNFKSLIKGATDLKDALVNILDKIADKLLDFGLDALFEGIKGSGLGKSLAGGVTGFLTSLFSFDGGGFTGNGPRSGGLDGKGGFLAMVHPNETVIDHTKGNSGASKGMALAYNAGGQAPVHVHMETHNNFNGVTREEVMSDMRAAMVDQETRIKRDLPTQINKHRFNQGRGMA